MQLTGVKNCSVLTIALFYADIAEIVGNTVGVAYYSLYIHIVF